MDSQMIMGYKSPMGWLELRATGQGLCALSFTNQPVENTSTAPVLNECKEQLDAFFSGSKEPFRLKLDLEGTPFQLSVWKELLKIPFGETVSYLTIATALGDPNATRAVGNANGKNPVAIIVPCHRVIGSGGSLVGYSGGMEKKKWLLEFERNLSKTDLFNSFQNEEAHG
jgi:methylated-DNA-[protein]-cysteine S-methyltransferase